MARYFMEDTRLAGLERMMMDSSRTPPASAGTQRNRHRKKRPSGWPAKHHELKQLYQGEMTSAELMRGISEKQQQGPQTGGRF